MDSYDIAEAMAYDRISPIGPERADINAGIIASTIANCNRSKNSKTFKVSDFTADYTPKTKLSEKEHLNTQIKEAFNFGNRS